MGKHSASKERKKHKKGTPSRSRSRSNSRKKQKKDQKQKNVVVKGGVQKASAQQIAREMAINDRTKAQAIKEELGYSNQDNPFGDENLATRFVWRRKEAAAAGAEDSARNMVPKTAEEIYAEVQRVKKNREERELEKLKLEEEKNRANREREEETYQQWLIKEQRFQEEQSKIRALNRLNIKSELPEDKLIKIAYIYRGKIKHQVRFETLMQNIGRYLKLLRAEQVEGVLREGRNQLNLSREWGTGMHTYWEAVLTLAQEALHETHLKEDYREEIEQMADGKSQEDIAALERDIENTLKNPEVFGVVDPEYWESILKFLRIRRAEAHLLQLYQQFQESVRQGKIELEHAEEVAAAAAAATGTEEEQLQQQQQLQLQQQVESVRAAASANISPALHEGVTNEDGTVIKAVTYEASRRQLEEAREILLKKKFDFSVQRLESKQRALRKQREIGVEPFSLSRQLEHDFPESFKEERTDSLTAKLIELEKSKPLEEGEEIFNDLVQGDELADGGGRDKTLGVAYNNGLKKPQYFNRVKMGYDWNNYNKMHFDDENPPPKIVQGYKFNIFYPELIDKTRSPDYTVEQLEGDTDFLVIRFVAGAPYEDLAFRIINREWELSDKYGFKCVFNRGILHLYFNFKRMKYKR